MFFVYGNNAIINQYLLKGEYKKASKKMVTIIQESGGFSNNLDKHRRLVLIYKSAWIDFVLGHLDPCIDKLNDIINSQKDHLRDDIYCYSKLMLLIAHFEKGHYELVNNLIGSVQRLFVRTGTHSETINHVINHLKWSSEIHGSKDMNKLEQLNKRLLKLRQDRFEKRSFILFNFNIWIQSKIEKKTMQKLSLGQS